jgi:DNA-binding MarR family transcriptional regulator
LSKTTQIFKNGAKTEPDKQTLMTGKKNMRLDVELVLKVLRAEEAFNGDLARLLKNYGLTPPQYNVLRILRGAGPAGLRCQQITARMISRVPDTTRLLDRLEQQGLVSRRRSGHDHRVVLTRIRPQGRHVLARLDRPILGLHRQQTAALSPGELRQLSHLLDKLLAGHNQQPR